MGPGVAEGAFGRAWRAPDRVREHGAVAPRPLGADCRRLVVAGTVSNLGDGVILAAAPSLAATLTTDARLVSGLAVAQTLPWLLFALVSGAVVDRLDRRTVMVAVDSFRALAFAALTLVVATDWVGLPLLYVVFFALGVSETLFDTAALSLMPSIVEPEQLTVANGRLQSGEVVANHLAGPPLGGLLFAGAAAAPFALEAVSFAVAALLVWRIRGARMPPGEDGPRAARRSLRVDIAEGIDFLFHHPLLRIIAVVLGVWNLLEYMMVGVMVLFCTRLLGLNEAGFGLVLSSMAIGGLLGGITSDRLTRAIGEGSTLRLVMLTSAVATAALPATRSTAVVVVASAVAGWVAVTWNVTTVSLRQAIVPDHLLGRVNSVYRLLAFGGMPFGALLGGVVAESYGLAAPFWVAAGITFVLALSLVLLVDNDSVARARADAMSPLSPGTAD